MGLINQIMVLGGQDFPLGFNGASIAMLVIAGILLYKYRSGTVQGG